MNATPLSLMIMLKSTFAATVPRTTGRLVTFNWRRDPARPGRAGNSKMHLSHVTHQQIKWILDDVMSSILNFWRTFIVLTDSQPRASWVRERAREILLSVQSVKWTYQFQTLLTSTHPSLRCNWRANNKAQVLWSRRLTAEYKAQSLSILLKVNKVSRLVNVSTPRGSYVL